MAAGVKYDSAFPSYTNNGRKHNKRLVLTTSTGSVLMVSLDHSGGDRSIAVWESTDRVTFTQRLVSNTLFANLASGYDAHIVADIYPNNDIGLAIHLGNQIVYARIAYATWTVTSEIVAGTMTSVNTPIGKHDSFDLSINEASIPTLAWFSWTNVDATFGNGLTLNISQKIGGVWVANTQTLVAAGTQVYLKALTLSLQYMANLGSGVQAARPVVFTAGWMTSAGVDSGINIYSCTLSDTAAGFTGFTLRTTVAAGVLLNASQSTWGASIRNSVVSYTGANEWTVAWSLYNASTKNNHFGVLRGTWNGSVWAITVPHQTTSVNSSQNIAMTNSGDAGESNMTGFTMGTSAVLFTFMGDNPATTLRGQVKLAIAKLVSGAFTFTTGYLGDNIEAILTTDSSHAHSNMSFQGDKNLLLGDTSRNSKNDSIYDSMVRLYGVSGGANPGGQWHFNLNPALPAPGPVGPASASTQTTSEPNIYADMTTGMTQPPTPVKVEWQFAKDAGFTTSIRNYLQADGKFTQVLNTQAAGVYVRMNDVLPLAQALVPSGTWYVRARQVNILGVAGAWTATQSFTVTHAPVATVTSPTGLIVLQYTTGVFNFAWTFSDAYANDSQTAYQIICERDDTGGTIFDTGKIVSTSGSYNGSIPATYKDIVLRWKVRVWDTSDVVGAYSSYATFRVADPPQATINYPENGGTVLSSMPYVEATPTTTGGRVITAYRIVITKNGSPHYDSNWITPSSPIPSGQKIIWSTASFTYTLNDDYSVVVYVRDNLNLEVAAAPVYYDTDWALPSTPAPVRVDSSKYNTEGYGHVIVQWDGAVEANLYGWILERRIGIPATLNTFIFEDWEEVYRTSENLVLYEYDDTMVPSGCQVEYRVIKQLALLGSISNSLPTAAVNAYVESDGYWLIDPTAVVGTVRAFKLSNVISESYSDEYEEAEFNLIGRGRHVDQGDRLGYKGQLVAQLRDSTNSTARAKKLILEDLKKQTGVVYLRNPFGDVFMVYLSTLQINRIAGVGRSEYVDVTVPYSEVS